MVSRKIEYDFDPYRRKVMRALCLTKLSGTDFRVLLFLLGQTDGYHRAQDDIKPSFFVERTGMDKGNIRRSIARLRTKWHMITKNRRIYEVLPPDQWDKDVFVETKNRINLEALLAEEPTENRFKSEAESSPADENRFQIEAPAASKLKRPEVEIEAVLASSKEHSSKEHLSKEVVGGKPPGLGVETPASKYLFEKTGRKRWQNLVQKEQFEKAECEAGEERMKEAIDWALTSGISNVKSIITAARRGKDGGPTRERTGFTRPPASRTTGRLDKEPTPEEYLRSLPPARRPGK